MQRDKNHEEVIEEIVERANKNAYGPDGMYTRGKGTNLDFDRINELVRYDLYEGFDPKKGITEHVSIDDAIKVFYRRSIV